MPVRQVIDRNPGRVLVFAEHVDSKARQQLEQLAQLPIIHGHVAAMPDVHAGIGSTVGSVIPTVDAIIPAAVGVDIGCGMVATRLSLGAGQLPDHLGGLRSAIEARVPVGFGAHELDRAPKRRAQAMASRLGAITDKHPAILRRQKRLEQAWVRQMGTLGGGNHFIEVCLDEENRVWVMLHSGSRGIGNAIGSYFIERAKEDMAGHLGNLPSKDLAYFREGSPNFGDYLEAVGWAQDYARENRAAMLELVLGALAEQLPPFTVEREAINCHHNYVAQEAHGGVDRVYVTRKGAIRAAEGDLGIIPGSMGARSYIVRGKGSPESLNSCAHGAGRRMSRGEAKQRFKTADLIAQTAGVECRKDRGVLDEIPGAYKDIDQVMADQTDLVEVVHTLKQVVCVKG